MTSTTDLENRVEVAIIRGQDSRDGEALRLLRDECESFSDETPRKILTSEDVTGVVVQVYGGGALMASAFGYSYADAADACRAALSPGRQPTNAPGSEGP